MGLFGFLRGKKQEKKVSADTVNNLLEKIELIPGLTIPRALADHWIDIEKTKLSFIHIDASATDDLNIEKSKFGHYPCMPLGVEYPLDSSGKPMFPLAQINCKELPDLEGFPKSGYLQFFISAFDDLYGLDFDNPQSQKDFRVLFFEEAEVENHKFDFNFLDDTMASDMLPVYKPHSLAFTAKEEYVGIGDLRQEESKVVANFFIHPDDLAKKDFSKVLYNWDCC